MPRSRKQRKTGLIEALIMSVVYVPEELKEMRSRIEEILDVVRIQNTILCQILPQSAKMGCLLKELSGLGKKLDAMNNSLEAMNDFVGFK
jgi:SMC interacting uncharacterized protein involved in chromosome segregation